MIHQHTDGRACIVKHHDSESDAILHPMLSSKDMAKVEYPDGNFRDVPWWKVRAVDTEELMDELFGEE